MNTTYTNKLFYPCMLLMMLIVFASCTSGVITTPSPTNTVKQQPAVVRIGWKGGPDTLNPGMAFLTNSYTIFNLVYDTMYELKMDNTYQLSLAESVSTSPDGIVWT